MTGVRPISLLLLALAAVTGCARDEPTPTACPEVDAGTPVDPALLAFLGKARAAHHTADILEEQNDLDGAIGALSALLRPGALPDRPEAHEVVADTHARLADLKSQLERFDEAQRDVEAGLKLAKEASYFRGHLFEMRGLVEERRAKQLKKGGQESEAKKAEALALEAFEQSMQIQQKVIEQALPDAGKHVDP